MQDKPLANNLVQDGRGYYKHLRDNCDALVKGHLPWTTEGIRKGVVGYDVEANRFTYTQLSEDGGPLNIKWGKGPDGESPFNVVGNGRNRLYPLHLLKDFTEKWIILAEGEPDTITLLSHDFQVLSGTGGAGSVPHDLSPLSKLDSVIIVYDADEPGRSGSSKMADAILKSCPAVEVFIAKWPDDKPDGYDITDFFQDGGTADEFESLMLKDLDLYLPDKPPIEKPSTTITGREPILTVLADIQPETVSWLWKPYIPLGKLTFLDGDPGVGKTWLALQIAAIVSKGDPLPSEDGVPRERQQPATVIYMTAEDGLADTLRPRLDKAGADTTKVIALEGWRETKDDDEETSGVITLQDLVVIEQALALHRPSLLVVDPIQGYLGAGIDMHRANEVRPVLSGISILAEKYVCTALMVRHLSKSPQARAVYRGLGSIDFSAAARSILLAGQDPDHPENRVLAHVKSNLAATGPSLGFKLRDDGFFWTGLSDVTPEALLAPYRGEEERSAMGEACRWLGDILSDGPMEAKNIYRLGREEGISERTIKRAKKSLSVDSRREGFGPSGKWIWSIISKELPPGA